MSQSFGVLGWRAVLCSLMLLVLSACGGGGGGSKTSISLSTKSMSFDVGTGQGETSKPILVQFEGSGVVVGYAPNVAPVSWATAVQTGMPSGDRMSFEIRVDPSGMAPGTYRTSLRFLTGIVPSGGYLEDARDISHTDLSITMVVVRFDTSPAAVTVNMIQGAPPSTGSFSLNTSNNAQWTAASGYSWLSLDKTSGTGSQLIGYSVSTAALTEGFHYGSITLTDSEGRRAIFGVNLFISAPQLSVTPYSTTVRSVAGSTASVSGSFSVDTSSFVEWTASSGESWLSTSSSGSGAGTVSYSVSAAGLSPGGYYGTVLVTYTGGRQQGHTVYFEVARPQLTLTPESLQFDIGSDLSAAARTRKLVVSDDLGGTMPSSAISWRVGYINAFWLTASPGSGTTAPPKEISVVIPAESLASMPNGTHQTSIVLYQDTDYYPYSNSWTIPVTLNLNSPVTALTVRRDDGGQAPIAGGPLLRFNSFATYAHGYEETVTSEVTWSSPDPAVLEFSSDDPGLARPLAPGNTSVRAVLARASKQAALEVRVGAATAVAYAVRDYDFPGIYQFIAGEDGRLQPMSTPLVQTAFRPSDLTFTPDGKFAYLVHQDSVGSGQYAISQFRVDSGGSLVPLEPNYVTIGSYYPQGAAVEPQGRQLYVATGYPTRVVRLAIGTDGKLTLDAKPPTDVGNSSSSTYSILAHPTEPYLYVPDFNANLVRSLEINADASLTVQPSTPATGENPQYAVAHPSGQYVYVTNAGYGYSSTAAVSQYIVSADGQLVPMATPMALEGKRGRGLSLAPSGKSAFLSFVTPNGYSSYDGEPGIATFAIDETGSLVHQYSYAVAALGDVAVNPNEAWLYAATGFNTILQYKIGADGTLVRDSYEVGVPTPRKLIVRQPPSTMTAPKKR